MGADRPSLTPCNDQNDQRNVADYSGSYPAHLSLMGNISNIALVEGSPQDRHSKSEGGLLAHEFLRKRHLKPSFLTILGDSAYVISMEIPEKGRHSTSIQPLDNKDNV